VTPLLMHHKHESNGSSHGTASLTIASSEAPLRFSAATMELVNDAEALSRHAKRLEELRPRPAAPPSR
jgi:hypothetical protein